MQEVSPVLLAEWMNLVAEIVPLPPAPCCMDIRGSQIAAQEIGRNDSGQSGRGSQF